VEKREPVLDGGCRGKKKADLKNGCSFEGNRYDRGKNAEGMEHSADS